AFKPDRGELVSKTMYTSTGTIFSKEVHANEYTYEDVGIKGLVIKTYNYTASGAPGVHLFSTQYEWKSAHKTKSTLETYAYDVVKRRTPPIYRKIESYHGSVRHSEPTGVVVSDGSGKVLSDVRSTYVADLIVPACGDLPTGLSTIDATLNTNLASVLS